MVSRRRYRRRRFVRRSRRRSYRRARVGRRMRRRNKNVLFMKRTTIERIPVFDIAVNMNRAFSVGSLPVSTQTEIQDLFDFYKLCMVKIRFDFSRSPPDGQATNSWNESVLFHYAHDYNDTAGGIVEDLLEYNNVQTRSLDANKPFKTTIRPCAAKMMYKTTVTTGYSPTRCWINTTDLSVPHYGLKGRIEPTNPNDGSKLLGYLVLTTTYYLACKSTK